MWVQAGVAAAVVMALRSDAGLLHGAQLLMWLSIVGVTKGWPRLLLAAPLAWFLLWWAVFEVLHWNSKRSKRMCAQTWRQLERLRGQHDLDVLLQIMAEAPGNKPVEASDIVQAIALKNA